jgi:hypothetical protein
MYDLYDKNKRCLKRLKLKTIKVYSQKAKDLLCKKIEDRLTSILEMMNLKGMILLDTPTMNVSRKKHVSN